jgi:seryl-tRNA synthetase
MHDIKAIRDNPEAFDRGLARRGLAPMADELLKIDAERRDHVQKLQDAQARRNACSKEIGEAMKAGDSVRAAALMAEVASIKDVIATGEATERQLDARIAEALAVIPNLPLDEVPDGTGEHDNVEVRRWGQAPQFAFEARQHFDIGEWLGLMDFEAAAKISGSRFVVLKGQLARLERALGQFMLDLHTSEYGYIECSPPLLVRSESAFGTGNLPKFKNDLFATSRSPKLQGFLDFLRDTQRDEVRGREIDPDFLRLLQQYVSDLENEERLWLIPTAEVALTNFVREQTLSEQQLPMRLTACTPCFRSEAGAAGRDTRGMIRQHQFTKVELVSITTPEQSRDELERMTACAESVLQKLGLAYRVMRLCAGDMGFGSRMTYDIEVWLPGQNAFREISSCSVCGDFQARRMDARYKPADGKGTRFVHTLNGSGLAVGRTLVAILENYQNADGTVTIPETLRPYMGGADKITRP